MPETTDPHTTRPPAADRGRARVKKGSGPAVWVALVLGCLVVLAGVLLVAESSVGTGPRAIGLTLTAFGLLAIAYWFGTRSAG